MSILSRLTVYTAAPVYLGDIRITKYHDQSVLIQQATTAGVA